MICFEVVVQNNPTEIVSTQKRPVMKWRNLTSFILFAVTNAKQMSLFSVWLQVMTCRGAGSVLLMWGGVRRSMECEGQRACWWHLGFVAQQVGCFVIKKIPLQSLLVRWAGTSHRVPQALLAFLVVKMMWVGMLPASEGWYLCILASPATFSALAGEHQWDGLQTFTLSTK